LFGKRTEIRDAHDNHANQAVAYLLQPIESSNDLVILASNQRAHIPEAFVRGLQSPISDAALFSDYDLGLCLCASQEDPQRDRIHPWFFPYVNVFLRTVRCELFFGN
jgi:hypothetical protein